MYAAKDTTVSFTTGEIAFYGELKTHKGAANLGTSKDLFHTDDANAYCRSVTRRYPYDTSDQATAAMAAEAIQKGLRTGGSTSTDSEVATIQMGAIASGIHTGGDTNPEMFVAGLGHGIAHVNSDLHDTEYYRTYNSGTGVNGTKLPSAIVFVNGKRNASSKWDSYHDEAEAGMGGTPWIEVSIGHRLSKVTQWNLSDAYYVNNWPGTPYTNHKGNGDNAYHYVTQVNYITGYICAASLH
ncbi:hypothetical protein S006_24720 [Salmonella enterica subsp. enterica serovar Give]|nr:hypothetical protein [Salmonella enterica subsp. enterica serovar Give]EKO1523071.1 hypothetical protein [Salmonella enterica]